MNEYEEAIADLARAAQSLEFAAEAFRNADENADEAERRKFRYDPELRSALAQVRSELDDLSWYRDWFEYVGGLAAKDTA